MSKFIYIFLTISFTIAGQLLAKWRLGAIGKNLPAPFLEKIIFLIVLPFKDIYIFMTYVFAFSASLFWLMTLSKMPLSVAYPFMSLAFVFVIFFSILFLNEPLNIWIFSGTVLLILGLFCFSKGL